MPQPPVEVDRVSTWHADQAQEVTRGSAGLVVPLARLSIAPPQQKSEQAAPSNEAQLVFNEPPGLSLNPFTSTPVEIASALEARKDLWFQDLGLHQYLKDHNIDPCTLDHLWDHMKEQIFHAQYSRAENLGIPSDLHVYLHGNPIEVFRRVTHNCKKASQLLNEEFSVEDLIRRVYTGSGLSEERAVEAAQELLNDQAYTKLYDVLRAKLPRLSNCLDYDFQSFIKLSAVESTFAAADKKMAEAVASVCCKQWSGHVQDPWQLRLVAYIAVGQPIDVYKHYEFYRRLSAQKGKVTAEICELNPFITVKAQKEAFSKDPTVRELERKSRLGKVSKEHLVPLRKYMEIVLLPKKKIGATAIHELRKAALWLISTGHMIVEDLPQALINRLADDFALNHIGSSSLREANSKNARRKLKLVEGLEIHKGKKEVKTTVATRAAQRARKEAKPVKPVTRAMQEKETVFAAPHLAPRIEIGPKTEPDTFDFSAPLAIQEIQPVKEQDAISEMEL